MLRQPQFPGLEDQHRHHRKQAQRQHKAHPLHHPMRGKDHLHHWHGRVQRGRNAHKGGQGGGIAPLLRQGNPRHQGQPHQPPHQNAIRLATDSFAVRPAALSRLRLLR